MSGMNTGIIPLAVLCSGLVLGGIAAIYITRKIAKMRMLRQQMLAQQEALAEETFYGSEPVLTDVYIGPPPDIPDGDHVHPISWPDFQPMAGGLSHTLSCPHPHHAVQHKPGYLNNPLVDGNIINVTVGIVMPSSSLNTNSPHRSEGGPAVDTLDYYLGTATPVICTLLGSRQRLVGFN